MTEGRVKLADGTVLKIIANILDAREHGFSPFGGVNIAVSQTGGSAVVEVSPELLEAVKDKPLCLPNNQPQDGWEMIDITEVTPVKAETKIETSMGSFLVKLVNQPTMVTRNLNYKSDLNDPVYIISFASIVSWKKV